MGMESFRLDFIYASSTQKEMVDYLKIEFKLENNYFITRKLFMPKRILIENEYRIEDYIIAHFNDSEATFSLEACFSNYEKNILICHKIYIYLKEKFDVDIKWKNEILKESADIISFQQKINNFYSLKYESFLSKYSIRNIDMLPGEFFYKNYKRIK